MTVTMRRGLVVAGAAVAVLGGAVAPVSAAGMGAQASYTNTRVEKTYAPDKAACFTMKGETKSGKALYQAKCGKNSTQRWDIKRVGTSGGNNLYVIKNRKSGKCLYVGSKTSGSAITQVKCKTSDSHQQWVLSGSRIINKWASKAILSPNDKSGTKLKTGKWGGGSKDESWGLS
ncbi:ricin-type beta-trefoil lectin domain protein [Streptomyces pathocidini]|uniref:RICIN domain-containing protein n=1 Tax=Streptomyces pathocidini TaxID=1650571 RepID=UPI0033F4BB11